MSNDKIMYEKPDLIIQSRCSLKLFAIQAVGEEQFPVAYSEWILLIYVVFGNWLTALRASCTMSRVVTLRHRSRFSRYLFAGRFFWIGVPLVIACSIFIRNTSSSKVCFSSAQRCGSGIRTAIIVGMRTSGIVLHFEGRSCTIGGNICLSRRSEDRCGPVAIGWAALSFVWHSAHILVS